MTFAKGYTPWNRKFNLSRKELEELYWDRKLSLLEIGRKLNLDFKSVQEWMIKYGIPRRNHSEALKIAYKKGRSSYFKGKTPWNKGKPICTNTGRTHFTSEKVKGEKNAFYGKKHTRETREVLSRKISQLWKNPKWVRKVRKNKKPTEPERKLIDIIRKYDLPFKYVGDGSVIIYSLNPDFIEYNGKKKIIEVFGDYWHAKERRVPWHQTEQGRRAIYSQLGYDTLIIWEHELISNKYGKSIREEQIVGRIREFVGESNGV